MGAAKSPKSVGIRPVHVNDGTSVRSASPKPLPTGSRLHRIQTGPGRSENLTNPTRLLLYNFDVDDSYLKIDHQKALEASVVPILRKGGSLSIVGLASRSGSFRHNDYLSVERAEGVRTFLQKCVPNGFAVREFKGFGERKAQLDGQRDGTEDERYRCVILFLSSGPQPPVPNMDGSSLQEIPLPEVVGTEGVLDTVGKILDVMSSLGSILNLALDAVLIDLAGLAITALSSIIGMPAVWLESNKFTFQNGKKLGLSRALQQMADAFDDDDLRSQPETSWPSVPRPVPKFAGPDDAVTLAERSAREGERKGYEAAWALIMKLEKEPRIFPLKLKGKTVRIKLSGRALLWLMHRAYGDDVWRKILQRLG